MWNTIKGKFDSTDSFVSLALGLAVVLVIGMTVINYVKSKTQTATSNQETTENKAGASLPTNHTVAAGETLWSISEKYYNSGYNWVDIEKANEGQNPDVIEEGQTLIIPAATPIVPPQGEASSAAITNQPKDKSYTVVQGDDLWNIALKEYGTGYKWTDIAAANKLTDPNIIHPGNVLVMP